MHVVYSVQTTYIKDILALTTFKFVSDLIFVVGMNGHLQERLIFRKSHVWVYVIENVKFGVPSKPDVYYWNVVL